jgi:hypothetical protein
MRMWIRDVLIFWAILIITAVLMTSTQAQEKKKVMDKEFIAVSSYLILMTVFDVETTFAVVRNGGHENNPVMKPFIKSGRLATYGVQLGVDALFIWLAYEMKGSKHKEFRKIWWVAPVVLGTEHGVMGGLNLRYCW